MSKIKEIKTTVYKCTGPVVPPAQNFCTNPTDLLKESEDKMKSFRFHKWLVCEVIDENGIVGIGNAALAPEVTKKAIDCYLKNLIINESIMKTSAEKGFILATDIADYLTKKGLPFRQSHIIMTKLSNHCKKLGKDLSEISIEEYKSISKFFSDDVKNISVNQSINSREIKGGTSLNQIKDAIKMMR